MEKCPVCKAALRGRQTCRRCGADLLLMVEAGARARQQFQKAVAAYKQQDFSKMLTHARRSLGLMDTPQTRKLVACAALFTGRYAQACSIHASHIEKGP